MVARENVEGPRATAKENHRRSEGVQEQQAAAIRRQDGGGDERHMGNGRTRTAAAPHRRQTMNVSDVAGQAFPWIVSYIMLSSPFAFAVA
jgi:hypothetical protein